jgi:thioredoxin reductase (NADPH)
LRDLVIIGAGPAGLAVAIAAQQAGLDYEVIEKGTLVNSIFHFPRGMIFFTTPELLEIGGLPFVTPYEKPTQGEALKYYRRVTDRYEIKIRLGVRVVSMQQLDGGFGLALESEREGKMWGETRTVAVATGYYDNPNCVGVPGEDLLHVSHYYREPHAYYRKRVVIVGGKNSAAIAALELYRAGAGVTLVHRQPQLSPSIKYWIRPDIDNRIKEGSITAWFETRVVEITRETVVLAGPTGSETIGADAVFLLTGYHPDVDLLRPIGVRADPTSLVPEHNAETLETNVPGVYLAGAIVSGKETGRIFIENGRFHGEAIVTAIRQRLRRA